ncbi:hypothetical protein TorRG33x02_143000 [Trema orientale]|uniref:Uncharacterized protein n=1 Tax=Trema orientale TaxID=63057 RepID=A0A2P5EWU2_TREOI|nr:hypothetical protein TorRG33x02_143000 [Trema orientale]
MGFMGRSVVVVVVVVASNGGMEMRLSVASNGGEVVVMGLEEKEGGEAAFGDMGES